jgi:hypothetical protein
MTADELGTGLKAGHKINAQRSYFPSVLDDVKTES